MKKDGHRAVLQEGFDKRAFAETLRVAMQNLPTGVVWFDMSGHCIYANSEAFRLFDVPDSLAKLEVILKDWFQEDALSSPEATVWLQQYGEKGSLRSLQICRYPLNDGTGMDVGMYFLISDCTQDQKNLDLEHFGTMHDALTGIYNKYGFYRQARHVMDDNPHVEYLMVCLNFGDFKLLNGLYGMTKGNELLVRVGGMLRRRYGQDPRTAYGRIRADRFAMMIPEAILTRTTISRRSRRSCTGSRPSASTCRSRSASAASRTGACRSRCSATARFWRRAS